eukprot:gb/GEZN01002633.1/.p1 GENE.gb/GEZN01002633.1/~~gb/GEZN01002633.1/.p1  ORF type:complete len:462 (-),score=128.97 gb/GEZN01002633.1/:314-1699(-)
MQGLRTYTCATCLCEFGCMTALHECVRCKKPFDYSPEDFNRKVRCGRAKCPGPEFGFWLHAISERVMKEIRATLKEEAEARLRRRNAKDARRKRGQARGTGDTEQMDERGFTLGLSDSCPRCGEDFSQNPKFRTEQEKTLHLMSCTDEKKIKQHKRRKAEVLEKESAQEDQQRLQEEAGAKAAWQALGGKQEQLWLLSAPQLKEMCIEAGASKEELADADQSDLIGTLVSLQDFSSDQQLLIEGPGGGRKAAKRSRLTAQTLPKNLRALSLQELKGVAAAHGLKLKSKLKSEIIEEMEREAYSGADDELGQATPALLAPARKPKKQQPDKPLMLTQHADDTSSDSEEPLVVRKRPRKRPTKNLVDDEDEEKDEEEVEVFSDEENAVPKKKETKVSSEFAGLKKKEMEVSSDEEYAAPKKKAKAKSKKKKKKSEKGKAKSKKKKDRLGSWGSDQESDSDYVP